MRRLVLLGVILATLVAPACSGARQQTPMAPAGPAPSEEAPVVVYGARYCQYTRAALDYFRARSIPARFRDVQSDTAAYDEMIDRARAANVDVRGRIPVLLVRDRVLVGYHQDEVERALAD